VPIRLKSMLEKGEKGISGIKKNPRALVIAGLIGIMLIFLSTCFSNEDETEIVEKTVSISAEQYRSSLENSVKEIVADITGDTQSTVVVTLESGIRYSYADSTETNSSNTKSNGGGTESKTSTHSYITVRTADGGEQALLITELMPEVRGVAIICKGGDDEIIAQKIKGAVTAAFSITSKRVYIAGGNSYEKR